MIFEFYKPVKTVFCYYATEIFITVTEKVPVKLEMNSLDLI